jgi:hypothetical protein
MFFKENTSIYSIIKKGEIDMNRPYKNWSENQIRNGIWSLSTGMSIPGGYTDIELLRDELRYRGLSEEGYHNT